MPRHHALALLLLALPGLSPADAMPAAAPAVQPYAAASQVDLTQILASPPGAEETRKELATLLKIQKTRTKEEAAACIADQVISVYRFADVLGDKFTAENTPKTNILFQRIIATIHVPLEKAQKYWTRKRPPLMDPEIKPAGMTPSTAAYPSGHGTAGPLMGTVLADLLPGWAEKLHARGALFAYRRIQAGVHYPSDIQAGALSAAAIFQALSQDPEFRSDFAAAQAELAPAFGHGSMDSEKQGSMESKSGDEKGEY
jgi:acid phosphatase (class A)